MKHASWNAIMGISFVLNLLSFFMVFNFEINSAFAQTRRCPVRGEIDALHGNSHRLYYFDSSGANANLWYTDRFGQHQTLYTVRDEGWIARMSPDGKQILIVYVQHDTDEVNIDILSVIDEAVRTWTLPNELEIETSPQTAIWIGNEHIGFEIVSSQELFVQNVTTQEFAITEWYIPDDIDEAEPLGVVPSFLYFSPNYQYMYYPVATNESSQNVETLKLIQIETQEIVQEFVGRNPNWAANSEKIYLLDESGNILIVSTDGNAETLSLESEAELLLLTSSPSETTIMAVGFFNPRTVQPNSVMFLIDIESQEIFDICSYGRLETLHQGRFNNQVGVWSQDEALFAYSMETFAGSQIFVLDLVQFSLSIAVQDFEHIPIIVGWSVSD